MKTLHIEFDPFPDFDPDGEPLEVVIEALLVALESVPAEYRSLVKFSTERDCESYLASIKVTYSRPETDEEEIVRLAKEEDRRQRQAQEQEANLRRQYEALKRKFEPSIAPAKGKKDE